MATTFEDAIDLIGKASNPYDFPRQLPNILEGLNNLKDRLQAVERLRIDDMNRMQRMETLTAEEKVELTSLATDRTTLQRQVADLERKLEAQTKAPVDQVPSYSPLDPVKPAPFLHSDPKPPVAPAPFPKAPVPSAPKPDDAPGHSLSETLGFTKTEPLGVPHPTV